MLHLRAYIGYSLRHACSFSSLAHHNGAREGALRQLWLNERETGKVNRQDAKHAKYAKRIRSSLFLGVLGVSLATWRFISQSAFDKHGHWA
ncbi:MAG: hypothetical protein ACTHMA_17555 [Thermomicrobiales bacterium]